jgi:hypothetical protein
MECKWVRCLGEDLTAEPDMLRAFRDTWELGLHSCLSLPFEAGENRRVAVKIIDDRGIESLKIVDL